jgi:hypothetical protein
VGQAVMPPIICAANGYHAEYIRLRKFVFLLYRQFRAERNAAIWARVLEALE